MGKLLGIIFSVLLFLFLVGKCAGNDDVYDPEVENAKLEFEASEFDSPTLPPTTEGAPVPVPSDPNASYRMLSKSTMPNGHLEVVTRRDGPSGTSFSRREISCGDMTFRYLGEGDTLNQAMNDGPNPGDMGPLTEGSISTYVSQFACQRG